MAAGWAGTDVKAAAARLNERQPDWLGESWRENTIDQKYRIASGWLDADPDALFAWAAGRQDQAEVQAILANVASTLASRSLVPAWLGHSLLWAIAADN